LNLRPILFALLLAAPIAGCFGIFGGGGPEASAVLTVLNDLDPPAAMTIELRRDGDDESTVGTVPGGAERTLTYSSTNLQGAYQLVARQASGAAVVSREFTLFPDAQVRWQLRTNSVIVSQSR